MIEQHVLDKNIPIPLYYQLKTIIDTEIQKGNYRPGDLIPTEEELIAFFGISRTTVRQAVTELVQEGKLYRIKGKGTFVAKSKLNQDFVMRLESYNHQMARLGKRPSTEVLDFKLGVTPANVAEALQIKTKDPIIFLQRKRFADDAPIVVLKTYLPMPMCAFVLDHNFTTESLYDVLEEHGPEFKVHHVVRVAEAIKASPVVAKHLCIKTGDPILYFTSTAYTAAGIPIEYSRAFYRGDSNRFEMTIMA